MELQKIQGYTLIELLIVIALMTGLSTILLLNGAESRNIARLERAAKQLESALTEAKAYGTSGRAFPAGSSAPADFDKGYGVYVTTGATGEANKKIIIYGGLGIPNTSAQEKYSGVAQDSEIINLEGSVYVKRIQSGGSAFSQGHIIFRRGQVGGHIYTQTNSVLSLRITLGVGSTVEKTIEVNETGLIFICKVSDCSS